MIHRSPRPSACHLKILRTGSLSWFGQQPEMVLYRPIFWQAYWQRPDKYEIPYFLGRTFILYALRKNDSSLLLDIMSLSIGLTCGLKMAWTRMWCSPIWACLADHKSIYWTMEINSIQLNFLIPSDNRLVKDLPLQAILATLISWLADGINYCLIYCFRNHDFLTPVLWWKSSWNIQLVWTKNMEDRWEVVTEYGPEIVGKGNN